MKSCNLYSKIYLKTLCIAWIELDLTLPVALPMYKSSFMFWRIGKKSILYKLMDYAYLRLNNGQIIL